MVLGLFWRYFAAINEHLHEALVFGQLLDDMLAHEINAAVAHTSIIDIAIAHDEDNAGGSHAREFGLLLGALQDGLIASIDSCHDGFIGIFEVIGFQEGTNGLNGCMRGYGTAHMAAHTITHHSDKAVLAFKLVEPVLVGRTLATNVGQTFDVAVIIFLALHKYVLIDLCV